MKRKLTGLLGERIARKIGSTPNTEEQNSRRKVRTPTRKKSVGGGSKRRRHPNTADDGTPKNEQNASNTALRDFTLQTIQTGIEGLVKEFATLKAETGAPPTAKTAFDANPDKNRYKDVFCGDETRVVLKWPPGSTSDYIHANWASIRGEKKFICSQGPTESTLNDFWRMIWEHKCRAIVMLCNVVEQGRKKCEQYYPEKPEDPPIVTSSNIVIKNLGSTELENILTVSVLEMTVGEETFSVRHYFWNSWPDRGVPSNIMACLRLLSRVKTYYPVVVHCSAGIGRTGTIVGLEICQQTIALGEPLSMLSVVKELRACRHGAVQTDIQYVYMHRVMMGLAENKKIVTQEELNPFYDSYDAFLKSRGC